MNAVDLVEQMPDTPSGRKKPGKRTPYGVSEVVAFVKGAEPLTPDEVRFTIDHQPPPLSACFTNVRRNGRADTPRYKAFKSGVDFDLHRQRLIGFYGKPRFNCPIAVTYIIRKPDNRARDLGNLEKALSDTLVRNFIIKDDSQISDLRLRWMNPSTDAFYGAVHVEIKKL